MEFRVQLSFHKEEVSHEECSDHGQHAGNRARDGFGVFTIGLLRDALRQRRVHPPGADANLAAVFRAVSIYPLRRAEQARSGGALGSRGREIRRGRSLDQQRGAKRAARLDLSHGRVLCPRRHRHQHRGRDTRLPGCGGGDDPSGSRRDLQHGRPRLKRHDPEEDDSIRHLEACSYVFHEGTRQRA